MRESEPKRRHPAGPLPASPVEFQLGVLFLAITSLLHLLRPTIVSHDFTRGLGAGIGVCCAACFILTLIRSRSRRIAMQQDPHTGT